MPQAVSDEFQSAVLSEIDDLALETNPLRDSYIPVWRKNYRRYIGDQWDKEAPRGRSQFTFNLIQNAVLGVTAIQTEARPSVAFRGRESNEPGVAFIRKRGAMLLEQLAAQGVAVPKFTPEQVAGVEPVPEGFAETLNGLDPEAAFVVDDAATADVLTRVFEICWDRADTDSWLEENIINTNVVGWQPTLIGWDEERMTWTLRNLHPENVWIDELTTPTRKPEFGIVVDVMSADRAKQLYPDQADVIDREKTKSAEVVPVYNSRSVQTSLSPRQYNRVSSREMVVITTAWQTGRPVPITPEEAVELGLVQVEQEPIETEEGVAFQELYYLPDGTLTDPEDDSFPRETTARVRETTFIGRTIVEVREAPFGEIPIAININVPIPFQPYGQGEPERLEDAQVYLNRMASITHDLLRRQQSPLQMMPQSVKNSLKAGERNLGPGDVITAEDQLYRDFNGQLVSVQQTATPSSQMMTAWFQLPGFIDNISGNVDVLRGVTPGSDASGRAIGQLQLAARGPITLKARATERMLRQVASYCVKMLASYLPPAMVARMVTDVPAGAVSAIMDRALTAEFDVQASILAGRGTSKQLRQQMYMTLAQMQQIDTKTLLDALEIEDSDEIVRRMFGQQQAQVQMQTNAAIQQNEASQRAAAENEEDGEDE